MDYKEIKKLIEDMGNSKLTEIEIEFPDGIKISMKKDGPAKLSAPMPAVKENAEIILAEETKLPAVPKSEDFDGNIVKSPMVGTFYARSSSTAEAFVEIGSKVKKGDTLCIIEAMKLMNEIESEYDGEIVEILVKDGEMVDYGKPLFVIK